MSFWLWRKLVRTLRRRGAGRRESGAFLLAPQGEWRICEFICYDDLDPQAFARGYVHFDGRAFVKLWRHCEASHRHVVADVHTHPGEWVDQSDSDQQYPTVPIADHLALILPCFAKKPGLSLARVGIHRYGADGSWSPATPREQFFRLTLL